MIVNKKNLNIEYRFISIGGCESHDKEQFNNTSIGVGLWIYQWVG